MTKDLFDAKYQRLKTKSDQHVQEVHDLTLAAGNDEMIKSMTELRNRLNDPYMFVIVGEVKAGKSSFINALLESEEEICAVAASPMTDTIQQIVYGTEASEVSINEHLKRIYRPVEILKEIAIVDTPGTNTIIAHHQEITEKFIPASDLIIFVFESKNPYRQSAWEFFDLIKEEWKKKIIFILQQKDLMRGDDLATNIEGVKKHAQEKGIEDPQIYAVSALQEQEGLKTESGYQPLRNYIKNEITGGRSYYLKLQSSLKTSNQFLERIKKALDQRLLQYEKDIAFRDDVKETLDNQANRSYKQVELMISHLNQSYENIWQSRRSELSDGLSVVSVIKRSFQSMFGGKKKLSVWLDGVANSIETDMKEKLYVRLEEDVQDLADAIQNIVKFIDLKVQSANSVISNDVNFFRDISERRANILKDLQAAFKKYINDKDSFKNEKLFPGVKDASPQIATGSGIAVIGIILTTVTNMAVLDFTGGIVTGLGLLFAGVSAGLSRRKVLKKFDDEMSQGQIKLKQNLEHDLNKYIDTIKDHITNHFSRFDDYLSSEKEDVTNLTVKHGTLITGSEDVLKEIEGFLEK